MDLTAKLKVVFRLMQKNQYRFLTPANDFLLLMINRYSTENDERPSHGTNSVNVLTSVTITHCKPSLA